MRLAPMRTGLLALLLMVLISGCGSDAAPAQAGVAGGIAGIGLSTTADAASTPAVETRSAPSTPAAATAEPRLQVVNSVQPAAQPFAGSPVPVPALTSAPQSPVSTPPATVAVPSATPLPPTATATPKPPAASATPRFELHPLQIEQMRRQEYPGSEITVEETLQPGSNYRRYVVSYRSDGLKIFALMTIPSGPRPATGWPIIILNHGTIEPSLHRTKERYIYYIDTFARNGYIVFKSDYRGHGSSEGTPVSAYTSPAYTADVLNAVASVKRHPDADPKRIGMWGHSMGGQLTIRSMVVTRDIKAGVIWGGSVGPYPDIHARGSGPAVFALHPWRRQLIDRYGSPEDNPEFWAAMSPNSFLAELSGPVELHHAVNDDVVPLAASQSLVRQAAEAGQRIELFTYPNENHNINLNAANFALAMQRTVAFFDRHVKAAQ